MAHVVTLLSVAPLGGALDITFRKMSLQSPCALRNDSLDIAPPDNGQTDEKILIPHIDILANEQIFSLLQCNNTFVCGTRLSEPD